MVMSKNELDILEYAGDGYSRVVNGAKWTIAALNYAARFDERNITELERHNLTDETFVLLCGEATLFVGDAARRVKLEPLKFYNVRAGTWHNITAWAGRNIMDFKDIRKGCFVSVVGRLRNNKYVGNDGNERYVVEVVAGKLQPYAPAERTV